MIPVLTQDASAKTFAVVIPEGAGDPQQTLHYLPSELTVSVNDKVQWSNLDTTTHTVTSGSFQGGPDGIFNSGLLEPNEIFVHQTTLDEIGKLSYYCTIHPWMNGFISVLDPEGLPAGRIGEAGSLEAAQGHVEEAQSFVESAKNLADEGYDNQAAVSFIQAAINYHNSALEYALLDDHENAAKYHHEAGMQHHNAALHFEKWGDFTQALIQQHHAGVHHHFAGVQYELMGDQKNAGKHFAEALLHKGKAKFGSDYVLPPKHQMRWLADASDLNCKEGLEMVLKSTTKEPACVKPQTAERLIERGWAISP